TAAPRSTAASWLSSRRQAWLRAAALGAGDALGAGTGFGGGGAPNGKENCAAAGVAQRTRMDRAGPGPRKTFVSAVPIMEPDPTVRVADGSAGMVTKV